MSAHWLAVLGCICALSTMGHSAAVPTQDTMVVARSDASTPAPALETTTELTTEEPAAPIKLTEMDVRSEVYLRYAHTAVVAHVRNPAKRAQEATFRVLLPETAFISGFVMTLDGKAYKAYVKEKEEAKQIYSDAVSQGIGAAHIATKARDSNHFTVSVNVEALSTAVFNLTYEELLVRRNGVYNHVINLHPGTLVPKLTVTVHIKESQKITELRVPEIRTGNEIDATKDDAQNPKAVIVRSPENLEATITFSPDLEEQQKLMSVYAEKSKESSSHRTNSWYHQEEETSTEGVLGQFVVQYDVDRSKEGEVLVNDGYFVHFFSPSNLPALSKYVVFVLDTSGSMMDRKIIQLREAMQTILSDLNEHDYFSIVEFATSVTVHDLKEADQEPPKRQYVYNYDSVEVPNLVPPSQATPENIAKAKVIVSRLDAYGGTNINSALDVAINLVQLGVGNKQPMNISEIQPTPLPSTSNLEEKGKEAPSNTEVVKVQASTEESKKEEVKKLEPIIIFLTDGDPTIGETRPSIIMNHITEKNLGENKASIFSLAFGEDADRKFLRKLSLRNDGFMRHIYEAADAALQLRDFYKQVSSPLLADVKFTYPPGQVKAESLTKRMFRTFYDGSEIIVAGRIDDSVTELTPQLSAFCGVSEAGSHGYGRKKYEVSPKIPVGRNKNEFLPLERMWAYLTIKQLLDAQDAKLDDSSSTSEKDKSPEKKALTLALKYEFVTPLTSLVVVKPNASNAVDAESVDKPNLPLAFGAPLPVNLARPIASYSSGYSGASSGVSAYGSSLLPSHDLSTNFYSEAEVAVDDYDDIGFAAKSSFAAGGSMHGIGLQASMVGASPFYGHFAPHTFSSHRDVSSYRIELTTPAPILQTTTSPLGEYKLEEFSWAEPLLDTYAGSLVLNVNGTTVILKLSKDTEVPKKSGGDEPCAKSLDGDAGVCVYLSRCEGAQNITAALYYPTYCTVNEGYAGVCCSSAKVDAPGSH